MIYHLVCQPVSAVKVFWYEHPISSDTKVTTEQTSPCLDSTEKASASWRNGSGSAQRPPAEMCSTGLSFKCEANKDSLPQFLNIFPSMAGPRGRHIIGLLACVILCSTTALSDPNMPTKNNFSEQFYFNYSIVGLMKFCQQSGL